MVERDKSKGQGVGSGETPAAVPERPDLLEQDAFLDEALAESFPASDPIAPDHEPPKHPST